MSDTYDLAPTKAEASIKELAEADLAPAEELETDDEAVAEEPVDEEPTDEAKPEEPVAEEPKVEGPVKVSDETDSVLAAHIRRQANWEEDAKQIFFGPTEEEKRKQKILDDMSAMDAQRQRELAEDQRLKAEEAERETAVETAAANRAKAKELRAQASALEAEAKRLDRLVKK